MKQSPDTNTSIENTVSIREFARCATVSDTAIRKAISDGRIPADCVKRNKKNDRPELIYEKTLIAWLAVGGVMSKTPIFLNADVAPLKTVEALAVNIKKEGDLFNQPVAKDKPAKEVGEGVGAYAMANTRQVVLKANLLEIELEQKQGILVNKEKVYKSLFDFGQTMRSKFLAIPDRHIDNIFSSKDRNEAHTKLTVAIIEVLEYLSSHEAIS
jgi:hypothetical protein